MGIGSSIPTDREAYLKQLVEDEKKNNEKGNFEYSGDFDMPKYVAYKQGKEDKKGVVFRMVGNPHYSRKNGYDQKLLYQSQLTSDKDVNFKVLWPSDKEADWFWRDLYNYVAKGKYNSETESMDYDRTFKDEDGVKHNHPLLQFLLKGNKKKGDKYYGMEKGARPSGIVVTNVLDRTDKWCIENKHTKLLSKKKTGEKVKDDGEITEYFELGISGQSAKAIMDAILKYNKYSPWEVDILIHATEKKSSGDNVAGWEVALNCMEQASDIGIYSTKDDVDYISLASKDLILSKEEGEYEAYDFDTHPFFQASSNTKIYNRMKEYIAKVDAEFGTDFTEKAKAMVKAEKEKWDAEAKKEVDKEDPKKEEKAEEYAVKDEAKSEETPKKMRGSSPAPAEEDSSSSSSSEIDETVFKGYSNLTDAEKAVITGVKANGDLEFSDNDTSGCQKCKKDFPESLNTCPYCGETY